MESVGEYYNSRQRMDPNRIDQLENNALERIEERYSRKRLTFWEYTVFFLMTLLFLVLAYSLANMLHSFYREFVLGGEIVTFKHYLIMCIILFLVFFALDRYYFTFSILPY